jgi:hypothetical protein
LNAEKAQNAEKAPKKRWFAPTAVWDSEGELFLFSIMVELDEENEWQK